MNNSPPNTYQVQVGSGQPTPLFSGAGCASAFSMSPGVDIFVGDANVTPSSGIPLWGVGGAMMQFKSGSKWYGVTRPGTQGTVAICTGTEVGLFFLANALRQKTTILTPVQLAGLTTAFIAITETPAPGSRIVPAFLTAQYKFLGIDYGATGTFTFFWGATFSANFAYRALVATNFINAGTGVDMFAAQMGVSSPDTSGPQPKLLVDGQPIWVGNGAAPFAGGNGLVIITAFYTVVADQ